MHVIALIKWRTISINSFHQDQVTLLISEKTAILAEYFDFSNVFSSDSAVELPKDIGIIDYSINLLNNRQLPYSPIYNIKLVELEMLKIYIKANLASGSIRSSKSPAGTSILFVQKKDGSLHLCINYQEFNNLTIKNCYPIPLIGKSLNCLGHTKHFIQLKLMNAYYRMRIWEDDKWKTAFQTQYGYFKY